MKWISRLPSKQLLGVRIPPEAHDYLLLSLVMIPHLATFGDAKKVFPGNFASAAVIHLNALNASLPCFLNISIYVRFPDLWRINHAAILRQDA